MKVLSRILTAAAGAALLVQTCAPAPAATLPRTRAEATLFAARPLAASAMQGSYVGAMPASTTLSLYISLQGQHESELDALLEAQNSPGSVLYRQYLTPEQYGRYFGASVQDYAEAIATLRSHGFIIDRLPANHKDIEAHASVRAAEALFGTPIDVRSDRGRLFFSKRYEPIFPPALHAEAVDGLDNYVQLRPHVRVAPNVKIGGFPGWGAADIASTYDLTPIYKRGLDGTGVTIVDATEGLARAGDFAAFNKKFGLKATLVSVSPGKASPIDKYGETTLDVEWMAAIAPGVTIDQVTAAGLSDEDFDVMYSYIVNDLSTVHVVSTSWGDCEQEYGPDLKHDNDFFKQAYAEGQWWLSAAGDDGSDDCENGKTVSVDFPGSSPYVVSVGGTEVTPAKKSGGNYTGWKSEVVWDVTGQYGGAGGGGTSVVFAKPSFQKTLAPSGKMREVPDVTLMADDSDPNGGYFVYYEGQWGDGWGGTSFAAPMWGGFLALIQQHYGRRAISSPLVRLYALAGTKQYHALFHDITQGCNTFDKVPGFCAAPGYDRASGLGSFIGSALEASY